MGERQDYLDERRQQAIYEMEDILDHLEQLKSLYKINSVELDRTIELVIEKGLEIGEYRENISGLDDILTDLNKELEQSREELMI